MSVWLYCVEQIATFCMFTTALREDGSRLQAAFQTRNLLLVSLFHTSFNAPQLRQFWQFNKSVFYCVLQGIRMCFEYSRVHMHLIASDCLHRCRSVKSTRLDSSSCSGVAFIWERGLGTRVSDHRPFVQPCQSYFSV